MTWNEVCALMCDGVDALTGVCPGRTSSTFACSIGNEQLIIHCNVAYMYLNYDLMCK